MLLIFKLRVAFQRQECFKYFLFLCLADCVGNWKPYRLPHDIGDDARVDTGFSSPRAALQALFLTCNCTNYPHAWLSVLRRAASCDCR